MARKTSGPKRLYYKIGEACKLLDIQPYVLRYWETEFQELAPSKSRSGQRVYTETELRIVRRIKELLYDEGYTIAGAKKKLEADLAAGGPEALPAESGEGAKGAKEAPGELDTRAAERIETLTAGITDALRQAREVLELLGSKPS